MHLPEASRARTLRVALARGRPGGANDGDDLKPFRYRNQRRTTIMVKAPASFINDTLWPEFEQISGALHAFVDQLTDRVLADVFQGDGSDAPEVAAPPQLPAAVDVKE